MKVALALAVGLVLLMLANLWLARNEVDVSAALLPPGSGSPPSLLPGRDPGGNSIEPADLAATFERPLFSPNRRKYVRQAAVAEPPPEPVAVATEAVDPSPVASFALLGVARSGSVRKALLRVEGSDTARWYAGGDVVEGWGVTTVTADEAVLDRDGQSLRLRLYPHGEKAVPHDDGQR